MWDSTAEALLGNQEGQLPNDNFMPQVQEMDMKLHGEKRIQKSKIQRNQTKMT